MKKIKITKKKVMRFLLIIVAILAIFCISNIMLAIRRGNQKVTITTSKSYYSDSKLSGGISVYDTKNNQVTGTAKLELLDSNGKKVKGTNTKIELNDNETTNFEFDVPKLDEGIYYVKVTANTSKGKDIVKQAINITNKNAANVTTTLDKGIYKPGDTVNFRTLITSKTTDEPIKQDINISIYDGNSNRVYNENIETSEFGIASGKFQIADEVNSGTYKLAVTLENKEYATSFIVNPYKIPKFEIKLLTDKERYIAGENAKITVDSNYFFGEPVKNAKVKIYVDDEEAITGLTNEQGKYEYDILNLEAKKYNVKVELTDESNYVVEESKVLVVGTDLFEIELLPESGKLVNNLNNQIYIFTKKADGTPVKTYVTVQSGKITKQVATDENGIGSFNIDVEVPTTNSSYLYKSNSSKSSYTPKQTFNIIAQDTENNEIKKTIDLEVSNDSIKISTDKLKYNIGEDIKINLDSNNDSKECNVYIYKNDKLLKTLSTTEDNLNVNLENTYGIVDIYVTNKKDITNLSDAYKKTIFITPNKNMNIQISTDKEEYAPGENINISFDITQDSEKKDTALLVSMLDEAVLNLADNDISIDNIKLALSDIKFTEDLDAVTLYSAIQENKSEQTIMALLLKQENKNINIKNSTLTGDEEKDQAVVKSVISGIAVLIIIVVFAMIRNGKTKNVLKVIISLLGIIGAIYIATSGIFYEIFDYENWIVTLIFSTAISILLYFTIFNKYEKSIFNTSIISIIVCLIIYAMVFACNIIDGMDSNTNIFTAILIILAILAIAIVIIKKKIKDNEKIQKKVDKIFNVIIKVVILFVIGVVSIIFTMIILAMMHGIVEIFDGYGYWIDYLVVLIYGIIFNFINIKYSKYKKESDYKKVLSIGTILSVCLGIVFAFMIISFIVRGINESEEFITNNNYKNNILTPSDVTGITSEAQSDETTGGSIFSGIEKALDKFSTSKVETDETKNSESQIAENTVSNEEEPTTQSEITNKVRNVFLESMCFIPELIAENGKANVPLTLSDNITTWQIQTIGNTKDGEVGYSSKQIKVFKEFFVDYELPNNSYKGDKISIPITVYNYTNETKEVELKIVQSDWFTLNGVTETIKINVEAQGTKMQYIPIEIKEIGKKVFRVEATSEELQDIVEKDINIEINGYKKQNVVSSGTIKKDEIQEDILFLEDIVENSNRSVEVKLYSTPAAQVIEGMENIFKMPTGCFEQVSSSLYPDIVTLKYMEDNNIINESIKNKALNYINSGYQKLLTYEVKNEKGGYSLYGHSPAETVLTAYGLMEIKDLSEIYSVDDNVISNMEEFLFKKQNSNGTFKITGSHLGGASSSNTLALNAYITWAISEVKPEDTRLQSSIKYLEEKIEETTDNYTLALIANALANVNNKNASKAVNKILETLNIENNKANVTSNIRDYYGSYGNIQTIQTTALTSIALSKLGENKKTNETLINYIISAKDVRGTWGTTQATTLAIKSLIEYNAKEDIDNQEITVKVNNDERKIQVGENSLDVYNISFDNLEKENKITINIPKGKIYYEVVQTYYVPYDKIDVQSSNIKVNISMPETMKVNEKVTAKLNIENASDNDIENGQVVINIPQGFTVEEESLELLATKGLIEKYEINYREILIYLRNFEKQAYKELEIQFTPSYPVEITGGSVRVYDYYNPTVEGLLMPRLIKVN